MNAGKRKINVLLIITDNQPADLLGCYGNDEIHTPHINHLASQGIRFQQAYCPNGMCSPSRASLLTGLMPSQHGIHTWLDDRVMEQWPEQWNAIEEFKSLPEILQKEGYKTALIGKYHVGMPFQPQNGFAYWVTFPHGHTRSFWGNTIIDNGRQTTYPGHSVDCFTEKAVAYIKGHKKNEDPPFFLYLAYNAPYGHKPAIAGPARNRFAHLYAGCPMNSVPREALSWEAIRRYDLKKDQSGGGIDYSDELTTPNDLTALRNYYSQMSMVDDGVGQALAALEEQNLAEDTLVIFTTDHGFSLGHNGFWGHGQATWPANTHRAAFHIPLLLRHTGHIIPGQTSPLLVSTIDLPVTILTYLGLDREPLNENSAARSFAPILRGEALAWENAVFMEQEETRAVRTTDWLYMQRFQGSKGYPFQDALYNLREDPEERNNLINDTQFTAVGKDLSGRIESFFDQYADPRYDLWHGGRAKSNSDKPFLWRDAWGDGWDIVY